jgi:hypothetical protein
VKHRAFSLDQIDLARGEGVEPKREDRDREQRRALRQRPQPAQFSGEVEDRAVDQSDRRWRGVGGRSPPRGPIMDADIVRPNRFAPVAIRIVFNPGKARDEEESRLAREHDRVDSMAAARRDDRREFAP